MSIHFICGSSGSGKSDCLYGKLIEMSEREPDRNIFLIVPEQSTMHTQKALVLRSPGEVLTNIDVLSFERLAFRVFGELGRTDTVLEDTGKTLILRRLAGMHEKELTVLKSRIHKTGYIDQIKSVISELMQYAVSAEDLAGLTGRLARKDGMYFKLCDIGVLYRAFEEYLKEGRITAEQLPEALSLVAEQSRLLRGAVFAFDGFTGFTPAQIRLLHALMRVAPEMYLTVTCDHGVDLLAKNRIEDLFYMSRKMVQAVMRAAEEEGVMPGEILWMEEIREGEKMARIGSRFAGNPVLSDMERRLFRGKRCESEVEPEGRIRICSCQNPAHELRFAASQIVHMVREQSLRWSDFAIVCADPAIYQPYAQEIFDDCGIPWFADVKKSILFSPLTEFLIAVLEIVEKDFAVESVFRMLKTGLTGMPREQMDRLENYCIARGIRGYRKWKEPFRIPARMDRNREPEELVSILKELNESREQVLSIVRPLYESCRGGSGNRGEKENAPDSGRKGAARPSVRRVSQILYEMLCAADVENRLHRKRLELERLGEEADASVYRQLYRIVMDLLDKYVELLGDECLPVREYREILEAGFAQARVGMIPPTNDCVILGDIERTRLADIRWLFFLGVNDGAVPKNTDHGGLLSQYERENLKNRYEVELAPTAREAVFIQKFYLYWNLTKPKDGLVISFSRLDAGGGAILPSWLIGVFQELYPTLTVEQEDAYEFHLPETPGTGMRQYIAGLDEAADGSAGPGFRVLHRWYLAHPESGVDPEKILDLRFPRAKREALSPEAALILYGTTLSNSVTRLERFAACPYAHFLEHGLRLQPREEYRFEAVDLGSLYHEILEAFSAKVAASVGWYRLTEGQMTEFLKASVEECMLAGKDSVLFETARSRYQLKMAERTMNTSIRALIRQIRAGEFVPDEYELPFSIRNGLFETDTYLEKPAELFLRGRIDRLDRYAGADGDYLRIVDYKSGNRRFDLNEFYYGLSMQLVVYLQAAMTMGKHRKQVHPGGVFYFHLDDPILDFPDDGFGDVTEEIQKSFQMKGLYHADMAERMDTGLSKRGSSLVIPARLNKDGGLRKNPSALSESQFLLLSDYAKERIREFGERILSGEIACEPYQLEQHNGCEYCGCRSVCGFEERGGQFRYRELEKQPESEIWQKLEGEGRRCQ